MSDDKNDPIEAAPNPDSDEGATNDTNKDETENVEKESPANEPSNSEPVTTDSPETEAATETTTETEAPEQEKTEDAKEEAPPSPDAKDKPAAPIVSSSKKTRPPYKYDPNKITLRFIFANRDGLTVTIDCKPADTVGEVKGALLSVWPEDLPSCTGGERVRLICMGKGMLMPDTRTLEDCQVPVFKTHPTPINVSVKPDVKLVESSNVKSDANPQRGSAAPSSPSHTEQASQGCACVIL